MENKNGRGIFLGVVSVATLIVAIIGATFAYFSAATNSAVNAVGVTSGDVSDLTFLASESNVAGTGLIPSTENIATYAAVLKTSDKCIDDNNNHVCGIYEFTITNPSTMAQEVTTTLTTNTKTNFENLSYKVFKGSLSETATTFSNTTSLYAASPLVAKKLVPDVGATHNIETYVIPAGQNVTYTIILWLDETNTSQNSEASGIFAGTINAGTGTSTGVTGVIAAAM